MPSPNSFFSSNPIITSVLASVLTFLALVGITGFVISQEKEQILAFFATPSTSPSVGTTTIDNLPGSLSLQAEDSRVTSIVEKANPAVVTIVVTKDVPVVEQYFERYSPFGELFGEDPFSIQVPRLRQRGTEEQEVGGGSGFIVTSDGLVVTNKHVVTDPAASYTAFSNEGKKYDVEVIARDPSLDIAILKLKGARATPSLAFGESDKLRLGQRVIAIGNALGEFRNSVSVGVVSGLSRSVVAGNGIGQSEQLEGVIQTDAAINPGNSGGPLLDLNGNVVGVNVAVALGSQSVGFALPASLVRGVVESVKQHGEIVRPYIGVRYTLITRSIQERNRLPVDYGALVTRGQAPTDLAVIPGSPADKAGIVENDILLEVNGAKITEGSSLANLIREKRVGDTITLKILHQGKEKEIKIKLEKSPVIS